MYAQIWVIGGNFMVLYIEGHIILGFFVKKCMNLNCWWFGLTEGNQGLQFFNEQIYYLCNVRKFKLNFKTTNM